MWITRVFHVLILSVILINAKKYESRCKLVRELMRSGTPNDIFLGQWVCLIEKVSKRDTSAFMVTPSGKKTYGLYQVALLDDDIRDDTACARLIFHREGFKYWPLWTTRCKNDNLITNEIYKCPDLSPLRSSPERITHSDILRYRRMLAARSSRLVARA
ncbi:Lysozyme-like protein 1 [Operophtera brumata]|uniref:lysozyme n=1 Tax=Operophtera brumata TaxID=104452 RepID=A0A0L7LA82_OPEBR|nr:Lysozyme-like protein 1 [Operophtera brumata]